MRKINDILIAANFTILIPYFFVFQSQLKVPELKWLILASFILLIVSLGLFIWYHFRYPKRKKIFDDLADQSKNTAADGIARVVEDLLEPYARASVRSDYLEKMVRIKSPQELEAFRVEIEKEKKRLEQELVRTKIADAKSSAFEKSAEGKAIRMVVESFLKNLHYEAQEHFKKAYKCPLDEKHAKLKNYADQISFSYRVHVFVSGCVMIIGAIVAQTLLA